MKSNLKHMATAVLLAMSATASAQTSSFGLGYDFVNSKPNIDVQFNRESAAEADNKYDFKIASRHYHLNPAAEAHFGSGTATSTDNILVGLNSYLKFGGRNANDKYTILHQVNLISPQLSSDKNFKVYQGFASIGYKFISYYMRRDKGGYFEFNIGVDLDAGLSKVDSLGSTKGITRIKGSPTVIWQFAGKTSSEDLNPALDPDFYYRLQFFASYLPMHFFSQDTRVIDKRNVGYLSAKLAYQVNPRLQITLGYKHGRFEPLYKKVDNVSLGFALVAK